jgi:hypothetical protein
MRSALIILGGLVLWLLCLGAAYLAAGLNARSVSITTAAFAVVWFIAAAGNMWMGVSRAGYAFGEELPIFLLIFAVPVAVAIFVKWMWWSGAS